MTESGISGLPGARVAVAGMNVIVDRFDGGQEMTMTATRIVVAVATPLEQRLVAAIAAADGRIDVRYERDLLPPLRSPANHGEADEFRRTADQEIRWRRMLADAEIVFGLPSGSAHDLANLVRENTGLRWLQLTDSRSYEQLQAADLTPKTLAGISITGTEGAHAGPLAEFAMSGILAFAKNLPQLLDDAKERRWQRRPMSDLAGKSMLVIGLGPVGLEVARLANAFGMHVFGVNRNGRGKVSGIDIIRPPRFLGDLLPVAHAVVVTLPLTEQTRRLIDARAVSRMRADSIFVNVGHGGVVDEPALIRGLEQGQPAAAVLAVSTTEPLPPQSPLWRLPNVLICPHTAAQSVQETERIVDSFAGNLRRYLRGDELIGTIRPTRSTGSASPSDR